MTSRGCLLKTFIVGDLKLELFLIVSFILINSKNLLEMQGLEIKSIFLLHNFGSISWYTLIDIIDIYMFMCVFVLLMNSNAACDWNVFNLPIHSILKATYPSYPPPFSFLRYAGTKPACTPVPRHTSLTSKRSAQFSQFRLTKKGEKEMRALNKLKQTNKMNKRNFY